MERKHWFWFGAVLLGLILLLGVLTQQREGLRCQFQSEGRAAAMAGQSVEQCPYRPRTEAWSCWFYGFLQARRERTEAGSLTGKVDD